MASSTVYLKEISWKNSTEYRPIRRSKTKRALIAGVIAAAGVLSLPSTGAQALGGNCEAWLENGVGYTLGAGQCYSLNSDTKARVTLDIALHPDFHSKWFTATNTVYRTIGWSATMQGWPRDARIDYAGR